MPCRVPSVVVVVVVVALSSSGCPTPKQDFTLPTVQGPSRDTMIYTQPDVPVDITVKLVRADGTPDTTTKFTWGPFANGEQQGFKTTATNPGKGVWTLTVQASQIGDYGVSGIAQIHGDPSGKQVSYDSPVIRVFGGPPSEVVPTSFQMQLVTGEKRPVAGVGLTPTFTTQHFPDMFATSNVPVTFSVDDATIATVSDDGLVTAVAPGTTSVRVHCGPQQSAIPVTVAAGTPGPPARGIYAPDGDVVDPKPAVFTTIAVAHNVGNVADRKMAMDSAGNIYTAAVPNFAGHASIGGQLPVILYSWTGSGFGTERVTPLEESPFDPHIEIDENDHIWLTYHSNPDTRSTLVVAERAVSDPPSAWHFHPIDATVAELAALGNKVSDYDKNPSFEKSATLPRAGGGVWVAWSQSVFNGFNEGGVLPPYNECIQIIRLAEITEGATNIEEVSRVFFDTQPHQSPCTDPLRSGFDDSNPIHLLPPGPGEDRPEILTALELDATAGATVRHHKDGAWTLEDRIPRDPHLPHPFDLERLSTLNVVRPLHQDGPYFIEYGLADDADHLGENHITGNGFDINVEQSDGTRFAPFMGYQTDEFVYFAHQEIGASLRRIALGGGTPFIDDPTAAWEGPDYLSERFQSVDLLSEISGFAIGGGHLSFLHTNDATGAAEILVRDLPGPQPTTHDPESSGVRISDGEFTAAVYRQQPLVLADGTRYVLTDSLTQALIDANFNVKDIPGGVLHSTGPGQPFVLTGSRTADFSLTLPTVFDGLRHMFAVGHHLVGIEVDGSVVESVRSTDDGATWNVLDTALTSVAAPFDASVEKLFPVFVDGAGATYAIRRGDGLHGPDPDYHLYYAPNLDDSATAFVDLGGTGDFKNSIPNVRLTPVPVDPYGLAPVPGAVWLVVDVAADTDHEGAHSLLVRRFVDGVLAEEHLWPVTGGFGLSPRARMQDLAASGDGALWFGIESANLDDETLYRLDPTTGVLTTSHFDEKMWVEPMPIVTLADGRLVFGYTTDVGHYQVRAVFRVSNDNGQTWSDCVEFRPGGGSGQLLSGLTAEPGGGFLAAVGDSSALEPWTDTLQLAQVLDYPPNTVPATGQRFAPVAWTMMHVDVP